MKAPTGYIKNLGWNFFYSNHILFLHVDYYQNGQNKIKTFENVPVDIIGKESKVRKFINSSNK